MSSPNDKKRILVTGANTGIGYALVERLATEKDCLVYLGSRNLEKGQAAKKALVEKHPKIKDQVEVLLIDVSNDDSVNNAAASLKGVTLDGLVNNAGVGFSTAGADPIAIIRTNYDGVKRVTKAFAPLLASQQGRVVHLSSGAASMWLRTQDEETKRVYSKPKSLEELDAHVQSLIDTKNTGAFSGYGLSKAAVSALTIIHAKEYPNLTIMSVTPGFVATNMTAGMSASLTPHQGCESTMSCLFNEKVTSGWYYGSDGLRSPLTVTRDPGCPEYQGEDNPDASKYNK